MSDEREMIVTLRDCCDNTWYRAVMERAADMIEGQLGVIECYEAMKEGVAIRIAELEQRLAAAEAAARFFSRYYDGPAESLLGEEDRKAFQWVELNRGEP